MAKKAKLTARLLLLLAVIGPGLVTSFADNDAGGIATYSAAGARFGYRMLWLLFLITFLLAIVQEMVARLGVVTGKGLADLIRENFGVRLTVLAILALLVANVATAVADFAGIAAALQIFHINKYLSVPLAALLIWIFVVLWNYKILERIFLVLGFTLFSYIIAGILIKPDWGQILLATFRPSFQFDFHFILLSVAIIGTTITPWMLFFLQSSVADKGLHLKHINYERADVVVGSFMTDFISYFIIIACAATLYRLNLPIHTAQDAALALAPVAGRYAGVLFAIGLLGAATLGAVILPLTTAYAICEAFGWESGLNRRLREAPIFYAIFTAVILIASFIVLLPRIPLFRAMIISQSVNGVLLPIILTFLVILVSNKKLMGKYTNTLTYNIISWTAIISIAVLSLLLFITSLWQPAL